MEDQNRLRGRTQGSVKLALAVLLLAGAVSPPAAAAGDEPQVEELRRQLAARDAEIAALKGELARVRAEGLPVGAVAAVSEPRRTPGQDDDDEELARALESSLVRQGGSVLRPGTMEVEPEASYFYSEPSEGRRRDDFGLAITGRIGLPGALQAEIRIPYVARDHWSGVGTSSGLGDVRLGLVKEIVAGSERSPSLLAFAQWRTKTGDIDRNPPTGYGQNAVQAGMSVVLRRDPAVLFGSLFYTANVGEAHLNNGARFRSGDLFGGRLGAYLAATPDTSFYAGVAFNSNLADRLNESRIDGSSRLSSMLELGMTTVIGRGRFLNITAGIGTSPAAPKFSLTASLPIRF